MQLGLVSSEVCVGADLFFRETFEGNGRSCAACHPVENNFTIDPEFIADLDDDDPLFVAENNHDLETLERPELLREFGLILENVDGFSDLENRFTMRGVPHTLSLSTSVTRPPTTIPLPQDMTGWSGDGAPGDGALRDFQNGAIAQHYPKTLDRQEGSDFRFATDEELDHIDAYMRSVGRTNEIDLATASFEDEGAEEGRLLFLGTARCNFCHANGGANTLGANRNFDTGVERVRLEELDDMGIPHDGGFGGANETQPNFDADGDGTLDSFGDGTFNSTPLIEAADTGPFFHTDAFRTIEDAVAFYDSAAFNESPSGQIAPIALEPDEIASLGRLLRVMNAAFNLQIALARLDAAYEMADISCDETIDVEKKLLFLAWLEVEDALDVLYGVHRLHREERAMLESAQRRIRQADDQKSSSKRKKKIREAQRRIAKAFEGFGTGLEMQIGEGTLMF